MAEVNYVEIFITTTCTSTKQTEEEIDLFVKEVVDLARYKLSYASTEIKIEKHRRIEDIHSTPRMGDG